ncbi:MAG TPA: HAD-IA family hydrolase [Kofleriaceae bacterium]
MLTAVRAIVFDLDGTLVDSLADIMTHLNAALVDHGLAPCRRDEITEWVGFGADQLVMRAVQRQDLVSPVLATFRARYRARPVVDSRVYDGIAAVLDSVASRYALAVLSNKPHELTVDVCHALLARWPFAAIAGQRPDRARKPDPQALRDVAAELGIAVEACVLVGDSEIDVATARAAGAPSIGVSWGLRPLPVLSGAQPDFLVHAPSELGRLFA